jgi:hypothetical protein
VGSAKAVNEDEIEKAKVMKINLIFFLWIEILRRQQQTLKVLLFQ